MNANEIEYWASLGKLNEIEKTIEMGHDVNAKGEEGYTAMHAAAENNHVDVLRYLVAKGGDLAAAVDSGETPLDVAKLSGASEAAEYLESL